MLRLVQAIGLVLFVVFSAGEALGFGDAGGACESECAKCHRMSLQEAAGILRSVNPEIEALEVAMSPVRGLWEVVIMARGRRGVAYVDFSKQYILTGSILKAATKENVTTAKLYDLSKVDFSAVPLGEAIVMGDPEARFKTIVFDDPD